MLNVWHHDKLVGHVGINDDGRWFFDYAKDWTDFPIMPQMPIGAPMANDLMHFRLVEWFFDNLLPEGAIRKAFAEQNRINENNTWQLLTRYGGDVAGALTLFPEDEAPSAAQSWTEIPTEDLADRIDKSKKGMPLMVQGERPRMSLAGAQEKMTLVVEGDRYLLPEQDSPTFHILKPESINKNYPYSPANEFFCMRLAAAMGLDVPHTEIRSIGPHRVYLIDRYDRTMEKESGHITRHHQLDLCQVAGRPKMDKYEDEGGLKAIDLFRAIELCSVPAVARKNMLQWIIFNYLIGNGDAHAKNIAFLLHGDKLSVAPFYDLVCVDAYHADYRLAMSIAGEMMAGHVEGVHWDVFAMQIGSNPRLVRSLLEKMSTKIIEYAKLVAVDTSFTKQEKNFIHNAILKVIYDRVDFAQYALKQPIIKPGELAHINDNGVVIDPDIINSLTEK